MRVWRILPKPKRDFAAAFDDGDPDMDEMAVAGDPENPMRVNLLAVVSWRTA